MKFGERMQGARTGPYAVRGTAWQGSYGVTFTMTEPQKVKGPDAVHLFKVLAQQTDAPPKWNFYKYVVDRRVR